MLYDLYISTSTNQGCDFRMHDGIAVTHTHTRLTPIFPGLPGWAGTRKVKPIWILLKQETVSGSGISWAICKSAPHSRQITMPVPHHSAFYRPDALPAAQPTASKHWRDGIAVTCDENTLLGCFYRTDEGQLLCIDVLLCVIVDRKTMLQLSNCRRSLIAVMRPSPVHWRCTFSVVRLFMIAWSSCSISLTFMINYTWWWCQLVVWCWQY